MRQITTWHLVIDDHVVSSEVSRVVSRSPVDMAGLSTALAPEMTRGAQNEHYRAIPVGQEFRYGAKNGKKHHCICGSMFNYLSSLTPGSARHLRNLIVDVRFLTQYPYVPMPSAIIAAMRPFFNFNRIILIVTGTIYLAAPVSAAEWPWGSTVGISKEDFIQQLTAKLTIPELAQHLSLIKYTDFADPITGEPNSFATVAADRGIGEINFW